MGLRPKLGEIMGLTEVVGLLLAIRVMSFAAMTATAAAAAAAARY